MASSKSVPLKLNGRVIGTCVVDEFGIVMHACVDAVDLTDDEKRVFGSQDLSGYSVTMNRNVLTHRNVFDEDPVEEGKHIWPHLRSR